MKRRKFLVGIGSLAASAATTVATGAFSEVSASRAVTVDVADDFRAFLRLEPIGDEGLNGDLTGRSFINGGKIEFEIPGDEPGENSNAEGVGIDSVYEFHDLFEVFNQGTQPVQIYSTYSGQNLADVALVNDDGVLRKDPPVLEAGKGMAVGLSIDTHGSNTGEFDETLTIIADQRDE